MSTSIFTVPAGQTMVFPAPALSSVLVQPAATGSASISFGPDGLSPIFALAPQGANTSPYSFCPSTLSGAFPASFSSNPMGQMGKVSVAATTAAATVCISDLQQYPGSFPERQTVFQSGVAYTLPSSTSELELASVRFPPGFFKSNFRLEWEAQLTVQNSVNVKTLKAYFGTSTNSATPGAIETAAAFNWSNVYTSMAGALATGSVFGRNDNANVIASNPGLVSAGGMGSSTTANVTTATVYGGPSAVEQVFILTGTKATAGETFTLDGLIVKVYQ
jgi:hypothetical protein